MRKRRTTPTDWWEMSMMWAAIILLSGFAILAAEPIAYGLAMLLSMELS